MESQAAACRCLLSPSSTSMNFSEHLQEKEFFINPSRAECSRHGQLIPDCRQALRNPCKTYFPINRNALATCFSSWDSGFSSHLQLLAYCIWTVQDKEGIISKIQFFHCFRKTRKKHIWKNKNEDLSGGEGLKFYLGLLLFQEWTWQFDGEWMKNCSPASNQREEAKENPALQMSRFREHFPLALSDQDFHFIRKFMD